jgi:hypothetical protein
MFFLIGASSPPSLRADPIAFEITWTLSYGGPAPATTSYTYDPVTALFTGFVVSFNSFSIDDLAASLNALSFTGRQQAQAGFPDPLLNQWQLNPISATEMRFRIHTHSFMVIESVTLFLRINPYRIWLVNTQLPKHRFQNRRRLPFADSA